MLELYKNIKARRIALKLTQQEVADALHYKDRGIISKIENGCIDLPISKIHEFAKLFHTTADILMGNDGVETTLEEQTIAELKPLLNDLNQQAHEMIIEYAQLLENSGKYKKHNFAKVVEG